MDAPTHPESFQRQISLMFPHDGGNSSTKKFFITLSNIEDAKIVIRPTTSIHEHLLLNGAELKVLKLDDDCGSLLLEFRKNRAAM